MEKYFKYLINQEKYRIIFIRVKKCFAKMYFVYIIQKLNAHWMKLNLISVEAAIIVFI